MARQTGSSYLIRGGIVIDGTGARGQHADIRVRGDRVVEIGKLKPEPGDIVVDASGRVVSPGFIDAHSHADGGILDDPNAETQIRQGITTSCVGQDGSSNSPLAEWFSKIERTGVALNFGSFVGHGTARDYAMGKDYKRPSTPAEIQKMRAFVAGEMKAGALGLSSGLEYDPGIYSTTEELIALAEVAGVYNGIYISHVRDEENKALESFTELIRIAREGRLPAQISHIKLASSNVWGKTGDVFRLMDNARREGLDISADVYPYNYWQSTIIVLIPTRNWDDRAAWAKGVAEVGGPANVLLTTYSPDPSWQGKTIADISKMTGKDFVTVIQEIVAKTHGDGPNKGHESVVVTAMREADVRAFIRDPRIMFCTDGGLHPTHPRGAGSFPRMLGYYCREQRLFSLEEAIRKATSLPAKRMAFKGRGQIAPGYKADLVIFDPRTIRDTATTKNPASPPIGLGDVFVNGTPVLAGGQITGKHPGEALRRKERS
jgi:N-acyl-D-amino-acid deacylase